MLINSHVNKHQAFPDLMVEDGKYPRKDERGTFWLWRVASLLADWLVNFLSPYWFRSLKRKECRLLRVKILSALGGGDEELQGLLLKSRPGVDLHPGDCACVGPLWTSHSILQSVQNCSEDVY